MRSFLRMASVLVLAVSAGEAAAQYRGSIGRPAPPVSGAMGAAGAVGSTLRPQSLTGSGIGSIRTAPDLQPNRTVAGFSAAPAADGSIQGPAAGDAPPPPDPAAAEGALDRILGPGWIERLPTVRKAHRLRGG